MIKSASQLKGKIKNLSGKDAKKAESYVRLFFMERFLERVSVSDYKHNFILKGGLLTYSDRLFWLPVTKEIRSLKRIKLLMFSIL